MTATPPITMKQSWAQSVALKQMLADDPAFWMCLETSTNAILNCLQNGGKLLIAGNGGSAADSQHFAAELVGRYQKERLGLPAIALTTDTSAVTAWSNDYSYDSYLARSLQALAKPNDLFVGISTSGNSKNIVQALEYAKQNRIASIALLGNDGGRALDLANHAVVIPSKVTARIQECHIMVIHMWCEAIDSHF